MSTATQAPKRRDAAEPEPGETGRLRHRKLTPARVVLHVFLLVTALGWLFPLLWALFNSFRDYAYTAANGYASFGGFTLGNYADAWERGNFLQTFGNSVLITVPAVVLTLLLASCVAFVLARFSFKLNLTLLGVFIAANLLPPQSLLIPIYRAASAWPVETEFTPERMASQTKAAV